jgi:putative hydrolase of the HAD superfamily
MDKSNICVVFDLDDTLYLERDYAQSGFRAVGEWCAEQLGLGGVQEETQRLFDQGRRGDLFQVALDRLRIQHDPQTVPAMVRIYREHVPRINLLPDAIKCLTHLRARVHLGLLTDGNTRSQWAKIDALGLRDWFDAIAVTGDWGIEFFKPHVRGYQYLESKFVKCQGRFVYVADNPSKDFFAPSILGWSAIRVRRSASLHEHQECPLELVRFEVSNLEPIPQLVSELFDVQIQM